MGRRVDGRRYGHLVEQRARSKYSLEKARESWHDAQYKNGVPVEIKGAQKGNHFRLWRDEHRRLKRASGYYVFVVYHPWASSIRATNFKRKKASDLDVAGKWYGAGGHRDQEQYELPIEEVF